MTNRRRVPPPRNAPEARPLRDRLQPTLFEPVDQARPAEPGGSSLPAAAGLTPRKVQGRRYTDPATLAIVVRVLIDDINTGIVNQIRQLGGRAVGLHRHPLPVLHGERLTLAGSEGPIDLGHVGQVTRVDTELIRTFCVAGVVPVIPSLALEDGEAWLNVNADTAAAAVAVQLDAEKLVFLSDTPGILMDKRDPETLVTHLDDGGCRDLIRRGVIDAGMIPKVEACLDALRGGVKKTHMIDGRLRHSLLLEIYTDRGVGTEIILE